MPLVLGFAGLLGMVMLLTSAITDASFADILSGKAGDLFRNDQAARAASGGQSVGGGAGGQSPGSGVGAAAGQTYNPHGTYGHLVSGLTFAGPDQGVDFTGKGTVFAPVDVKITRIDRHSGWPGGHIIVGQVLDTTWAHRLGHGYGRFIYFAEALNPVSALKVGDTVHAGQPIATLNSSYPGTEIGWAQDANGSAFGTTHDGKAGGPTPTHGQAFAAWIQSLRLIGAPR